MTTQDALETGFVASLQGHLDSQTTGFGTCRQARKTLLTQARALADLDLSLGLLPCDCIGVLGMAWLPTLSQKNFEQSRFPSRDSWK